MSGTVIAAWIFSGALIAGFWTLLRQRNMQFWIGSYVASAFTRRSGSGPAVTHVYFCFADHFEPFWNRVDKTVARNRVNRWLDRYPALAAKHHDSDGRVPQHSFFYPEEEYEVEILEGLARLCRDGYGAVEVHLHHDNDSADNLRRTINRFKAILHDRHGLLRKNADTGEIEYCFIHGNWALDNSRPDGRWCGICNEISVLVETGCRVDMTMPSAPSDTQTRKINSIYFARGEPGRCKSHDRGRDVALGEWGSADELLLVQGPLTLNWRNRKLGLIPRIEAGEISHDAPPSAQRVRLWGKCRIGLKNAPEHVFVKVHTHGAVDPTSEMLLGDGFDTLWTALEEQYRDGPGYCLHYVTAWEMYEKIREVAGQKTDAHRVPA